MHLISSLILFIQCTLHTCFEECIDVITELQVLLESKPNTVDFSLSPLNPNQTYIEIFSKGDSLQALKQLQVCNNFYISNHLIFFFLGICSAYEGPLQSVLNKTMEMQKHGGTFCHQVQYIFIIVCINFVSVLSVDQARYYSGKCYSIIHAF